MIKKILAVLIIAAAAAVPGLSAEHVDGNWFESECYGCPGDQVAKEVTNQQAAYRAAANEAQAILDGKTQGDLRTVRQKCLDLATWSYVKAEYAAAMGSGALAAGDTVTAQADYMICLTLAKIAQEVDLPEDVMGNEDDSKVRTSHTVGDQFAAIAKHQLAKIHRRK